MGYWRWALVSPDAVVPSQMVGMSASVNLPLHHKVQKFSSDAGSPRWSRKKGRKTVVVCWWLLSSGKMAVDYIAACSVCVLIRTSLTVQSASLPQL